MSENPTCCFEPCENPNALEYQKCHKEENNNGCGCSCDDGSWEEEQEERITVIRNRWTREDFL